MLAASQQAAKQLLSNYQKGTLSASELKILADLENELEDCGGSIETLLKKRHVAPDLISYVQNVVGKVTSGEATITDALSGLVA